MSLSSLCPKRITESNNVFPRPPPSTSFQNARLLLRMSLSVRLPLHTEICMTSTPGFVALLGNHTQDTQKTSRPTGQCVSFWLLDSNFENLVGNPCMWICVSARWGSKFNVPASMSRCLAWTPKKAIDSIRWLLSHSGL
jgi:hypothetical protein